MTEVILCVSLVATVGLSVIAYIAWVVADITDPEEDERDD